MLPNVVKIIKIYNSKRQVINNMDILFTSLAIIFFLLMFVCGVFVIIGSIRPHLVIRWGNA